MFKMVIQTKFLAAMFLALGFLSAAPGKESSELPDVFSEDLARFEDLARSPVEEQRFAAARGLGGLGHFSCEPALLRLLQDPASEVRREAAFGLGRAGRRPAVEALIESLEDRDPWVREQARLSLQRLSGWESPPSEATHSAAWREWRRQRSTPEHERKLRELAKTPIHLPRLFRELALFGGAGAEEALLDLQQRGLVPPGEREAFFSALEKVASARSIPVLADAAARHPAAAWALGNLGGEAAEQALLAALRAAGWPSLPLLLNLDRLRSRALYPFAPMLLHAFGLVSYRGQPDDLHLDPTPIQRVAARLLQRSGKAGEVADLLLRKLEGKEKPDLERLSSEARAVWSVLERMDGELKPGFHRADTQAESMPLAVLPHLAVDPQLAPRLLPLLKHPALVVRVYSGTALARLRSPEAVAAMVEILKEGYPFPDAATQASGKHGPEVSGTVRWKGYLAMALGWDGSETARQALEALAGDPQAPRDVRFGAAVGLRRIADPRSRPALERARRAEVVWWISEEVERAQEEIALKEKIAKPRQAEGQRASAAF